MTVPSSLFYHGRGTTTLPGLSLFWVRLLTSRYGQVDLVLFPINRTLFRLFWVLLERKRYEWCKHTSLWTLSIRWSPNNTTTRESTLFLMTTIYFFHIKLSDIIRITDGIRINDEIFKDRRPIYSTPYESVTWWYIVTFIFLTLMFIEIEECELTYVLIIHLERLYV